MLKLKPHIPKVATVLYTSQKNQNDIGNYLGLHRRIPKTAPETVASERPFRFQLSPKNSSLSLEQWIHCVLCIVYYILHCSFGLPGYFLSDCRSIGLWARTAKDDVSSQPKAEELYGGEEPKHNVSTPLQV